MSIFLFFFPITLSLSIHLPSSRLLYFSHTSRLCLLSVGENVAVHFSGVEGLTSDSTYQFAAAFAGFTLYTESGKVTDYVPLDADTIVPIPSGIFNMSYNFDLDSTVLAGEYSLSLQLNNAQGEELACFEFDAEVSHKQEPKQALKATVEEDTALELEYFSAHHELSNLKGMQKTWTSGFNKNFKSSSLADVASLCGAFIEREKEVRLPEATHLSAIKADELPQNFDAREAFPECNGVIGHVRDQSNCGSCWAFASVEAFNDRLCVATNGDFQQLLSTQHITSCCGFLGCFSFGCNGEQPTNAWKYF